MMQTGISLAIIASVLMHVSWNLMARHQPREAEPLWWVLLAHIVLLGPWGFYSLATDAQWNGRLVTLLCISALSNVAYFFALSSAYRHAPVALVYPLVRSSPLLIAVWSWLLFTEQLGMLAWLGIALNVGGLFLMASTGRGNHEGRALPWTMLAMFATSIYSLSDKAASAQVPSFGALMGYITVGYLASWMMMSVRLRADTGRWIPRTMVKPQVMIAGGLCIGSAYALVIHAMRELPAAEVVSYTNAGIVIATLASIVVFKERRQWQMRIAGSVLICIGLLVLVLGRMGTLA